ncbi:ABC-type sugar transport system ATPase subunit/ribose/xylose/arabinose/galactoside ABC-type transport system permease subunit [Inquilinus ginsengisoli]|uniref:ABC-type sugar transport system ATPase subunit/ribose/xylose/arabinose/galactoside ABC-type transport system permease subunit n=1 Tax=Inquilinus ginsengisoli TaxID=363840 RepID=A0ABU1JGW9_9PROT|nr:ATP-binding cassette domain-containing protein [Inquilinus ginsengisoli]MDR6287801.1 ABC-type sugar transport system ATPase subunit/ribose/xylose/arabinose/galactoside ABC-type transport system permease subunit [Inquilinus ginsengisoli]
MNQVTAMPSDGLVGARKCFGLAGASKSFGGTVALHDVSFSLWPGEVVALLGENGAGKSTCVKLLAGVYRPDAGHVVVDGRPAAFASPVDARHAGIAVMHQHPGLFPDLSVAENVFMGHTPRTALGAVDHAAVRGRARQLLDMIGLDCSPDLPLGRLRTSEQQLVEIARALSLGSRVLIMDEPTAALSQREVRRLFEVVARLKQQGVAMLFVGHRMDEIYEIADRITILRDGRFVGTERTADLPRDRAVQMMVGRSLTMMYPELPAAAGQPLLTVDGLSRDGVFEDIGFAVRPGEILGLGGLVGSGRTEIARVLFGIDAPDRGTVMLAGTPVAFASPRDAMAAGIAYVSEDRIGQSLVMDFDILTNASLTVIDQTTRLGLIAPAQERALVTPYVEQLKLRYRSLDQPVKTLSGGNQQKIVLSKWLATHPRLLILDEPTQGIDVQTKAEVHAMIAELARQGMAIILISSELPELLGMCHRVVVLREGRVAGEFAAAEATQERVMQAATGALAAPPPRPDTPIAAPTSSSPSPRRSLAGFAKRRELGLVAAIAAILLPIAVINPRVLSLENLTAISMDAALLIIVAVAQMLIIVTRNIDLSIASVIGLSAYAAASVVQAHPELGIAAGLGVACATGIACGLVNGLVITRGGVPSIVVTLGTLAVFRGLNSIVAGGKQISADQVPQAWLDMTSARLLGVPGVVIIAVTILLVAGLALRHLPAGRELYAIGSNPDGATLIGIRTHRRVLTSFAVAGLLAGLDGALWASRYATVDARVAMGYELTVIAAVVVGGVAIRGGAGTILGTVLGALLLLVINNGLTLVRVDPLWLQGIYGLVILAAVAIDATIARRGLKGAV